MIGIGDESRCGGAHRRRALPPGSDFAATIRAKWRKSSRSNSGGCCVEVALTPTAIGVRDTEDRAAGHFTIDRARWHEFLAAIKSGRYAR